MNWSAFKLRLEDLLNVDGVDSEVGIPDYILANNIVDHLQALRHTIQVTAEHKRVMEKLNK
jgi:hypothetical protein